jgi:UDP-N-acetylmuramate dehydrogenase
MRVKKNIKLASHTTFKIGGLAKYFCEVKNSNEAVEAFEFAKKKGLKTFLLGGGSNVLISDKGFDGLVIKVVSKGIQITKKGKNTIFFKVSSGEVWDKAVKLAVKKGWWGIENLSHIPGTCGAIAVQNVGAYGQEASRVINSVIAFEKRTKKIKIIKNRDCEFFYRKSIFNGKQKGKYLIFDVIIKLKINGKPNLSYRDLRNFFKGKKPDISEIRNAVIKIRDEKFPFPSKAKNGNAGSCFKNAIVNRNSFKKLSKRVKKNFGNDAVLLLEAKKFADGKKFKIPAAFLMDICGLRDVQIGGAGINHNQPLVIVNKTGKATSLEILKLISKIMREVYKKTGVALELEPELVGFSKKELSMIKI